ncbi:hypothetical protein NEICINOT_05067 [Neisseria cinerea ATCC 14685]|uniref:Uncharacterized protein n=1 Tax=Neisseria cinerea ATCC 14685 TaxID=546262 RepID=D0W5U7_NEICI|nr:hypothetical protein NEICINOT_05067 [Neisseria cinerea ATCC 14685]
MSGCRRSMIYFVNCLIITLFMPSEKPGRKRKTARLNRAA